MVRLKKIGLMLRSHWAMYLYVWVQFVVILAILCVEINNIHTGYYETYFVEDYDDNMYLYAEAMTYIREDMATTGIGETEMLQWISEIEGVEGVGYTLDCTECVVADEQYVVYVNDVMKNISYRMSEGVWLDEIVSDDDYVPVVVGSAVGNVYGVGDIFPMDNYASGEALMCKVVGVLDEHASTMALDQGGSSKTLPTDQYTSWNIYTSDTRVLEGLEPEEYVYPATNLILSLEEEYDEASLRQYGNIYPLKYMQGCSENNLVIFVNDIFNWYGILIFVILFGLFGTTYLILSKSMYETSVFSLLGMTKKRIASEHILMYGLVYLTALPAICVAWQKLTPVIQGTEYLWTDWHTVFLAVMAGIVVGIVALLSFGMTKKSPKEMMSVAKSMEN